MRLPTKLRLKSYRAALRALRCCTPVQANNLLLHSNSFSSISGLSLRNTLVTCKIHVRAERTQVGMYFSRQAGSLFKWFHMGQIKRFSGLSKNLWYLPEHFDWLISVKVLRDFIHMWKKVLLKKYFKLGPQFNLFNLIPRPLSELFSVQYRSTSPNENHWWCDMFLLLERDGRLLFCWCHTSSVLSTSNMKVWLNYTEM